MDEDYYVEVSDQEEVVSEVPPVDVPLAVVAPLNVEVPEIPDNPESPSPASSDVPSPPPSPLGDLPSFEGFFTTDDLLELEQWAEDSRAACNQPELRVEEPEIPWNLKFFLRVILGPQWELFLLRQSGEVCFEKSRAYLDIYNQLTSFSRRLWLWLFPAWTATESREQLELLAEAGEFWLL